MLQYYGITNKQIPYAAERSKEKWGKYTVGTKIKMYFGRKGKET